VAACKSSPTATALRAEARLRAAKGCLGPWQAAGLRARLGCVQVKALVEFLLENCGELFAEERREVSIRETEESPAAPQGSTGKSRHGGLSGAGAWDARLFGVACVGAGHHGVLSCEPRLPHGLCRAPASWGRNGLLCKMSCRLQTG